MGVEVEERELSVFVGGDRQYFKSGEIYDELFGQRERARYKEKEGKREKEEIPV